MQRFPPQTNRDDRGVVIKVLLSIPNSSLMKPVHYFSLLALMLPGASEAEVSPEEMPIHNLNVHGIIRPEGFVWANLVNGGNGWTLGSANGPLVTHAALDSQGYPNQMGPSDVYYLSLLVASTLNGDFSPNGVSNWSKDGVYTLEWIGSGDITVQLSGGGSLTLLDEDLSGPLKNRRYRFVGSGGNSSSLLVRLADNAGPDYARNIALWIPDVYGPTDADGVPARSVHPSSHGTDLVWNPEYIELIRNKAFGVLRLMGALRTNGNPMEEWTDRMQPDFLFHNFVLEDGTAEGDWQPDRLRPAGVAFEHLFRLGRLTGKDLWFNLPHAADNDFIERLADLAYAELEGTDLKLWLEYSNEVWHGRGTSTQFHIQGNYAADQATDLGLATSNFLDRLPTNSNQFAALYAARRSAEIWSIFERRFGEQADRIVGVLGGFSSNAWDYNEWVAAEAKGYGATLGDNPAYGRAVDPDLLALTTYFGVEIPVFNAFNEAMALGEAEGLRDAARIWLEDLYSGVVSFGNAQGDFQAGGGFNPASVDIAQTYGLEIVGYEGGPNNDPGSINVREFEGKIVETNVPGSQAGELTAHGARKAAYLLFPDRPQDAPWYISGNPANSSNYNRNNNPFTSFMYAMERSEAVYQAYRLQMELAKAQYMRTNAVFVDITRFFKFGNWGHLEFLGQQLETSPKFRAVRDFANDHRQLRPLGRPTGPGGAPRFVTPPGLPAFSIGDAVDLLIETTGGDGNRHCVVISPLLPPGLELEPTSDGNLRLKGYIAGELGHALGRTARFLVRVQDRDGDIEYRTFSFNLSPRIPEASGPNILTNGDFEDTTGFFSLGFREALSPEDATRGWAFNMSGARKFSQRGSDENNRFQPVNVNNQSDVGALLQIVEDKASTTGLARFSFETWAGDNDITVAIWGFRGTALEVQSQLEGATLYTHRSDASGLPSGELLLSTNLAGTLEGVWTEQLYAVDLGDGFDYLVIIFLGQEGPAGADMRLDNVSLRQAQKGITVSLVSEKDTIDERAPAGTGLIVSRSATGQPLTVELDFSGSAQESDFSVFPSSTVTFAPDGWTRRLPLLALDDGIVEGVENLLVNLVTGDHYQVNRTASVASIEVTERAEEDPFFAWASTIFDDPTAPEALPDADPDLDGWINLIEAKVGADPTDGLTSLTPILEQPEPGRLLVSIDNRIPGELQLNGSRDLVNWNLSVWDSTTAPASLVSVDLIPWLSESALFLRFETPANP